MIIFTPATSANLGPGFDSLGLSLKLYNEVRIKKNPFFAINIHGFGSDRINLKRRNAFISIFNETRKNINAPKENFKFVFFNNIPFSRGLGSSSAMIVGAIAAAYETAGLKISKSKILNLALNYEGHPDNIAPAVYGGFTTSIINNNKVLTQKTKIDKNLRAVVAIPNKIMSTKSSRQALPKNLSLKDATSNLSHAAFMSACFFAGDYNSLRAASLDKIHEDRRMKALPELFELRELAYREGALLSTLSGSGSSFFNLIYKDDARRLKERLEGKFPEFEFKILELDNDGFFIKSQK